MYKQTLLQNGFFFETFFTALKTNIIVLNTNKFQVFPTISFPFRPFFSQISSQTRKSDFTKQKLSFEKDSLFFLTFAMNVSNVDSSLKEFSNKFKILLFLWICNDCSILRSKTFQEIYFRKIYYRTIRVKAFHLFQLSWIHSSKRAALV